MGGSLHTAAQNASRRTERIATNPARAPAPWSWFRHHADATALAFLLIIFLASNYRIVLGLGCPLWDAARQFEPWQRLIADFARNGRLLLWNPWSSGGLPEFAEPQSGALSPLSILCGLATGGTSHGFTIWWLLNWFAGGAGIYLLARHLDTPAWGGVIVALGYLFSGFYVGHAEHVSWLHAYSFLPFLVLWFDRACIERSWRRAFETGALWGLSGLAGYPGHVLLTGATLALWGTGRLLAGTDGDTEANDPGADRRAAPRARGAHLVLPRAARIVAYLLLVALIGSLVLAPVYTGYFIEATGHSTRVQSSGWSRDQAVGSNALAPGALTTFASPWLARIQLGPATRLWAETDVTSASVYVGILIPLFALSALLLNPANRWRWWLAGMTALALAIAVGDHLPLRGWLYDLLPPFRYFRHASMFRGYAMFFLAVLAIAGIGDLARAGTRGHVRRRWLPVAALAAGALALLAFHDVVDRSGAARLPEHGLAIVHLCLWCVPFIVALLWLRTRSSAHLPALLILLAVTDAAAVAHLGRFTLVDESSAARLNRRNLDAWHTSSLDLLANGHPRVLQYGTGTTNNNNLAVKVPALVNYTALINTHLDRIAGSPALATLATGAERCWFSSAVLRTPCNETVMDALVARAESGGGVPLVIHPLGGSETDPSSSDSVAARIQAAPAMAAIQVDTHRYDPTRLELAVHSATAGWLLVTDRWSPGWKASVNGHSTTIHKALAVFRAVEIGEGLNEVRFDYEPVGHPWLLLSSWFVLAIALISAGARAALAPWGDVRVIDMTPESSTSGAPVPELSIVIPCYDAEEQIGRTLETLLDHLRRRGFDAEIIAVDDGSHDHTAGAAAALQRREVRILRHERNGGKGLAVRTGMLAARGQRCVFTDCDLPYGVEDLFRVVAALKHADIAVGSRRVAGARPGHARGSPLRQASSDVFSRVTSGLFRLETRDTQCGLKAFTAEAAQLVFERSRVNGFAFDVEALWIARRHGLRSVSVPVTLRKARYSSVRVVRHSIRMLVEIASIRVNALLGRYD